MTIPELIAGRLQEMDWNQSDLARATGIPKQNLSTILRGKRPLLVQHMIVIEAVLNLSLDYGRCEWRDIDDEV